MTGDRTGGVPGVRFLPNAITVLALCCGLSAVYFADRAINGTGPWLLAVGAIAAAAILDSLDGPAARLLNSTSRIGAELDSLSDLVSFGVAPALVVYLWTFSGGRGTGWLFCLLFAVCIALRLARFNSMLDTEPRPWAKGFFTGVPAPAAGLLVTVPLVLAIRFPQSEILRSDWITALWLLFIGMLAVSRVPSIALKSVRVSPAWIVPLLILLVAGVAALFFEPELTFTAGLMVYLLHLPYAGWKYLHLKAHPELWETTRPRNVRSRRRMGLRIPYRPRLRERERWADDDTTLQVSRNTSRRRRGRRLR